ncbi:MAG: hypothetical protein R3D70_22640 [Rhizobiaceae bacterium]
MAYFKATIEILVDADGEAEACDCVSETLREVLREFSPSSPLIDWHYAGPDGDPQPHDGTGFEYADPAQLGRPDHEEGSDATTE